MSDDEPSGRNGPVGARSPEEVRSGGGMMSRAKYPVTLIPIMVIMVAWELAVRLSHVPPAILPPLSSIFAAIWKHGGTKAPCGSTSRHARAG